MVRAEHKFSPFACSLLILAGVGAVAFLSGCGVQTTKPDLAVAGLRGIVHGGQQPVSGASIQLYAAGTTGYGSAATGLLTTPVTSGAGGNFTITGLYNCPSASTQVYLVATGGNPGLAAGTNNADLAMMTALGSCGNLSASTFVSINELTTVASVYALSQFMAAGGGSNLGTDTTLSVVGGNLQGLANAFSTVNNLVDTASGGAPGPSLPSGAAAPSSELNTLADILSICINSNGSSGECDALFMAAKPSAGSAPTNTIDAVLDIARNPGNNVDTLYNLLTGTPPFQPSLSSTPNDWTVDINYTGGGLSFPFDVAIDDSGNVWTGNLGNASLSKFSPAGTVLSPSTGFTGGGLGGSPFTIAIDGTGNVFTANEGLNSLSKFSNSGVALTPSGGYIDSQLSAPTGIALDLSYNVWVINFAGVSVVEYSNNFMPSTPLAVFTAGIDGPGRIALDPNTNIWIPNGGGTVSLQEFNAHGMLVSGLSGYTGGGLSNPLFLAIDASGNVWATNPPNSILSEFSKSGSPISGPSGYTGGGLSAGRYLVIDGASNIWVANENGSVSELANDGTPISPSTGYTGGGLSSSAGIAIDGSGNVWVANEGTSTLTEIVGAAAPAVTPLSTALRANLLGQRP